MGIPESQLRRWSHHGPQDSSKKTHEAIRAALKSHSWPAQMTYDFFLQGSYSNDTNIRGDSDVDTVVKLNDAFRYDCSALSENDQLELEKSFSDARYSWAKFRGEVIAALKSKFPGYVEYGNKSLKLKKNPPRLAADVVVCIEYRKYTSFDSFIEGIMFQNLQNKCWIVNYPKEHRKNGAAKNTATNNRYKRTVRMFKNARNHLVKAKIINQDLAPSYFLECLIYNAPDDMFKKDFQGTFYSIINWMYNNGFSKAVCQDNQECLFGHSTMQWSYEDAKTLSNNLTALWNDWN